MSTDLEETQDQLEEVKLECKKWAEDYDQLLFQIEKLTDPIYIEMENLNLQSVAKLINLKERLIRRKSLPSENHKRDVEKLNKEFTSVVFS